MASMLEDYVYALMRYGTLMLAAEDTRGQARGLGSELSIRLITEDKSYKIARMTGAAPKKQLEEMLQEMLATVRGEPSTDAIS